MADRPFEIDLANERVVIATMAKDAGARRRLASELTDADFGDERHRVLLRAHRELARRGLAWTEDAVVELAGGADAVGGFAYLRQILSDYEATPNVDFHVERMRLDSLRLELLATSLPEVAEAAKSRDVTTADLSGRLRRLAARSEAVQWGHALRGDSLRSAYWDELKVRRLVGDQVEATGFEHLDVKLLRGLMPGLGAIVGRPGHGKTTVLANLIGRRLAAGKSTYLCGWEMGPIDYLDMLVSTRTGIAADDLARRVRALSAEEARAIKAATEEVTDRDLLAIERNPFAGMPRAKPWEANDRNVGHLEATIAREAARYPLIAVDVFGKMLVDRRPDAVSEALVRLRNAAIANGVHLLLLHHTNREGAEGPPTLEGIKGSGAWEEECDLILGVDRPILRASAGHRRKQKDVLDLYGLKQRKGPGRFGVRFDFDGSRFAVEGERPLDVGALEREAGGD